MRTEAAADLVELIDYLRGLLDLVRGGQMDADYETRLRIEGGVVALEAALDLFDDEGPDALGQDDELTDDEHDTFEDIAERMRRNSDPS